MHFAKRAILLHGCILLAGISCRAANPADNNFHGGKLPEPPAQHDKWILPDGAERELALAAELLFDEGLADPRGCEYRVIKVASGWGKKSDTPLPPVHGWLLPENGEKKGQRFAVCWNGLVYPVLEVGDPCSLDADIDALLKTVNGKPGAVAERLSMEGETPEEISLASNTMLAVKVPLLLRLGKNAAASTVMSNGPGYRGIYEWPGTYGAMAGSFQLALLARAASAQIRGDDAMALASLRQLAAISAIAENIIGGTQQPLDKDRRKTMERQDSLVRDYIADMEDRRKELPHKPALELGRGKFPTKAAWIDALVADLEDVRIPNWVQAYGARGKMDPVMDALVKEGDDAVGPLLHCLQQDERFTRTVEEGPFDGAELDAPEFVRVNEAACVVLMHIADTSFDDALVKDLRGGTLEERLQLAAQIRAYCDKYKRMSEQEHCYAILANDRETPVRWKEAARKITHALQTAQARPGDRVQKTSLPGESLRGKADPGVTKLLIKRIREIPELPGIERDECYQSVFDMTDELLTWDPAGGKETALWVCNTLSLQFQAGHESQYEREWGALCNVITHMIKLGHDEALEGYAKMLRDSSPAKVREESGDFDWLWLLWTYRDKPAMKEAITYMFTDPRSPWPDYFREPSAWKQDESWMQRFDLFYSPMVGISEVRAMILAGLADRRPACKSVGLGDRPGGHDWVVALQMADPQLGAPENTLMQAPDPRAANGPAPGMLRVCDIFAGALRKLDGMPPFPVFLPEQDRDSAIAEDIDLLQRYGDRITDSDPQGFVAAFVFPKLDHPATAEDVAAGRAIFSLPPGSKARMLPMPSFPAGARWRADKLESGTSPGFDTPGKLREIEREWNNGMVWQAEEGFVDGKWQRFFGFTGTHGIARVPADEIEFMSTYATGRLDHSLDFVLGGQLDTPWSYLKLGGPMTVKCLLHNRSPYEQAVPAAPLYNPAKKALADGVQIHLYQLKKGQEQQDYDGTPVHDDPDGAWIEMPVKKKAVFQVKEAVRKLKPGEDWEAMVFDLRDFFDVKEKGDYFIRFTFDAGKLKFTGGETRYIRVAVSPVGMEEE